MANNDGLLDVKKQLYYKKAFDIAITQKNGFVTRNNLFEISLGFYKAKRWGDFQKSSNLLLKNAVESNDTINQAQVYRYKANYYKNFSVNDSAFYYYLKAEKLFKKLKDSSNIANILTNKSIVQYNAGDYVGADRSLTQAYTLLKNSNDNVKLFTTLNMMGLVSNETKDPVKAIEYGTKALELVRKNKLKTIIHEEATCLNNLGFYYQNQSNYKEAIRNYKLALQDKKLLAEAPDLYSFLVDNLAYSKFKLNDYDGLPDLFYKSLKVREQINASTLIVLSKIHLSEYYEAKNDTAFAQKFASEALLLAKTTRIPRDLLASLKQSSNVDHNNATKYSKDYIRISDSIQGVERNSQEKFARLQLETDEIIEQKDILEEKNRTLLYFFVVSSILIGFLFIIRAQRSKTRELVMKQAQQKANEDIYMMMISQQTLIEESRTVEKKRIARELHDGVLGRMFGARLNLDSLNSNTDERSIKKRLEYLFELKNIEQDIREISHDLSREKSVLINNFVSIVNNLLEEQSASFDAKVKATIDSEIKWDKINNTAKINLYRILQEGLQNINKYAKAKNIEVAFKTNQTNVYLILIDDGIGFEVNRKSKGIGLQNMISRTQECQGIFEIKSSKGKGTNITVSIPLENKLKPIEIELE